MAKSLFRSSTFWGATIAGGFTLLAAVTPTIGGMLIRHYPAYKADIEDVVGMLELIYTVTGLSGAGMAVRGRIKAGGVYTPDWMPGPDALELEAVVEQEPVSKQEMPSPQTRWESHQEAPRYQARGSMELPGRRSVDNPEEAL
jgi:hypothetical protein